MSHEDIVTGQNVSREKLEQARVFRRSPTRAEQLLWQRLKANRLNGVHFRRQQIIDGFVVDFYCHAAALVLEVDGPVYASRTLADRERDQVLSGRRLTVLHVTNGEVEHDIESVLQRIITAAPLPFREGAGG